MRALFATVLGLFLPLVSAGQSIILKNAADVARDLIGPDQRIPKTAVAESLCVVILPWMEAKQFLMDSTGAFGIVRATGNGAAACRSGASWRGPWSAAYLLQMEALGQDSREWGEKTDLVLLLHTRAAAERLLSGTFDLQGLTVQAGVALDAAGAGKPDVAVFALSWKATFGNETFRAGNQIISRQVVKSRERDRFGGLALSTVSSLKGGANDALYGTAVTARDVLGRAPAAPEPPPIPAMEYCGGYTKGTADFNTCALNRAYMVKAGEDYDKAAELRKIDESRRLWGAVAAVLDASSPSPE